MNKLTALIFSAGLVASASQSAGAAAPGEDSSAATAPKCAAGDKVVLVNTKAKTYSMTELGGKTSSAASAGEAGTGTTNTDKSGMARDTSESKGAGSSATAATAKDFSQMCKSKAEAMGAKMAPKTGDLLNSKAGTGGSH